MSEKSICFLIVWKYESVFAYEKMGCDAALFYMFAAYDD